MTGPSVTVETRVVDRAGVLAALRSAWADPAAELVDHVVSLVPGSSPTRGGVYRLNGSANSRGAARRWWLVLKVLRPLDAELPARVRARTPEELDAVSEAIRWDREALAYRSGLLDDLPPGLTAARCYQVEERDGDGVWLWLEDVDDGRGEWTVEDFARAAHHVGRFNAAYLMGRPIPVQPWLSRDWWPYVRFLAAEGWAVVSDPARWRSPLARIAFPSPPIVPLARLWGDLELFREALRRLPRTFCHHDAHHDNLFFHAEGMAAIDWQMCGPGVVGEEVGQLIAYRMKGYTLSTDQVAELDRAVFAGYVDGLRAAGWAGDARLARIGHLAAFVSRHALRVPQLDLLADESRHAAEERRRGMPMVEIARHHAELTRYVLDLGDEARRLIAELGARAP